MIRTVVAAKPLPHAVHREKLVDRIFAGDTPADSDRQAPTRLLAVASNIPDIYVMELVNLKCHVSKHG
jgi:hypothetical protein